MSKKDDDIIEFIRKSFEDNYELLKNETGRAIGADLKDAAFWQVIAYWEKMKAIAEAVTETEIKLTLAEQKTPDGRKYAIEGVVDIIEDRDGARMYDVKTHEAEYVEANKELYRNQLNVYAHVWQSISGKKLKSTAVIATGLPKKLLSALRMGEVATAKQEMQNWNPLVSLAVDVGSVKDTISDFAAVVDRIEKREFSPATADTLKAPVHSKTKTPFGTDICRNCDGRFSCSSYAMFAKAASGKHIEQFNQYYTYAASEQDGEAWKDAELGADKPGAEEIE